MTYCRRKLLSGLQERCIEAALLGPLFPFPRGFAADRSGPFFPLRTVQGLIERRRLDIVERRRSLIVKARVR